MLYPWAASQEVKAPPPLREPLLLVEGFIRFVFWICFGFRNNCYQWEHCLIAAEQRRERGHDQLRR